MSEINPWARANEAQYCEQTLILVPPSEQEAYNAILKEILEAGDSLNEGHAEVFVRQSRLAEAYAKRDKFFAVMRLAERDNVISFKRVKDVPTASFGV